MGLKNSIIKDILIELPYISEQQIASVRQQAKQTGQSWQKTIISKQLMHEVDLLKAAARKLGIGWTSLPLDKLDKQVMHQLDRRLASTYRMIIFGGDQQSKQVAMVNPTDSQALAFLENHYSGAQLKVYLTSEQAILRALDQYQNTIREVRPDSQLRDVSAQQTRDTLLRILEHATVHRASDIHIEPQTSCLVVRYRIDGRLRSSSKLPNYFLLSLTKEIKRLASLETYKHKIPQHGSFNLEIEGRSFLFNVSIVPTIAGEKIAIKVICLSDQVPGLSELGFLGDSHLKLSQELSQADGLILFCGAKSSGKTSSIYSCLEVLKQGQLSIATVEESIEKRLDGISQLQLDSRIGLDPLRAINILNHQDLDVVMIDSISTRAMAEAALGVAANGKLVLAGVYAPDACKAIRGLLDMGIASYLLAAKLRVVVAQRQLRRLAPKQAESYSPDKAELKQLAESLGVTTKNHWLKIGKASQQIAQELGMPVSPKLQLHRPKQPSQASAYQGSLNLNQVLVVDDKLKQAIAADASLAKLVRATSGAGSNSLGDDGLIKASLGLTSTEEVLRVI